ncbi:hypothetical protein FOZ62_004856, partial [Perkinsus olseni]
SCCPPSSMPTTTPSTSVTGCSRPISPLLPEPPFITAVTSTTPTAAPTSGVDPTSSPTSIISSSPSCGWGGAGRRGRAGGVTINSGGNSLHPYDRGMRGDEAHHRQHHHHRCYRQTSPAPRLQPPSHVAFPSTTRHHQQQQDSSTHQRKIDAAAAEQHQNSGNSKRVQMAIQQRIMQAANMYRDPCRTIAEILSVFDEFQRDGVEFNEIHTSTALHRLATAITKSGAGGSRPSDGCGGGGGAANSTNASVMATYVTSDARFVRLVERAKVLLPGATTRAVSNITWALSKLNYTDEGILDIVTEYMLTNLESFDTQGVSNCLYAFGLLRCSSGDRRRLLLDRLCEHIPPRLNEFKPQEISNCVYALARLGHRDDNFLAVVASYIP